MNPDQIAELSKPLDKSHVKEREQSGRKLSYIEGWHAIAEANRIFGFDAWTRETIDIRCVSENARKIGRPPNQRDGFGVSYIARVRVTVNGLIREGIGAGHGIDADLGLAHESAIKEAETDAMKRALMTFGNPFGLALYDKSQANVSSDPKSVSAAEMKRGLEAIEQDLLDCHSDADVKKCYAGWTSIFERDGWSRDYYDIAFEKFKARRIALQAQAATQQNNDPQDISNNAYAKAFNGG